MQSSAAAKSAKIICSSSSHSTLAQKTTPNILPVFSKENGEENKGVSVNAVLNSYISRRNSGGALRQKRKDKKSRKKKKIEKERVNKLRKIAKKERRCYY